MMACHRDPTTTPEPESAPVRVGTLPPIPFPLAQGTLAFRRVFEGVKESLDDELPAPALDTERVYRRWVEVELHDWLDRRGTAIRAATNRARSLSAHGTDEEAGIAHAFVAYLIERTVESVVAAEVPGESTDPARAEALRGAWRDSLAELRRASLEHWAECARAFRLASPEDASWGLRCEDEAEGVVAPSASEPQAPSGADETDEAADASSD